MLRLPPHLVDLGAGCMIAPTVLFLKTADAPPVGVRIGAGTIIRDYTIVYDGVIIGSDCTIDHHVIMRERTRIGNKTRIMNYTEIGQDVTIGEDCRIAGYLANRCTVGSRSSCFGYLVHRYPVHGGGMIEESPIIGSDVIVGRLAVVAGGIVIPDGDRIRAGELRAVPSHGRESESVVAQAQPDEREKP